MASGLSSLVNALPLWRLTLLRRKLFEAAGKTTYSRPAYGGVVARIRTHCPEPGVFVEAGAVDGFFESNTYELERFHGWRGLLVEPVPEMHARISTTRPRAIAVNCALVSDPAATPFVAVAAAHAYSRVIDPAAPDGNLQTGAVVRVPARALSALLDEHGLHHIDVLSLDVEGYELEVLGGLDLTRHKPRFMIIECLTPESRVAMDAYLAGHYRVAEMLTYRDVLYAAI